jgi:hypothetical protein
MIEEDLIFPCGPPPFNVEDIESPISPRSHTTSFTSDSSLHARPSIYQLSKESLPWSSPATVPWPTYSSSRSTFTMSRATLPSLGHGNNDHPQDHTRLKTAWNAMLSSRFLSAQLVTVLPFYLSSAFVDVRTHPTIQIPLPPNSPREGNWDCEQNIDLKILCDLMTPSSKTENGSSTPTKESFSQRKVPSRSPMHLAKTVQTVIECKESIWVEYEKLYCSLVPRVIRSARVKEAQMVAFYPSAREDFEKAWSNWER